MLVDLLIDLFSKQYIWLS